MCSSLQTIIFLYIFCSIQQHLLQTLIFKICQIICIGLNIKYLKCYYFTIVCRNQILILLLFILLNNLLFIKNSIHKSENVLNEGCLTSNHWGAALYLRYLPLGRVVPQILTLGPHYKNLNISTPLLKHISAPAMIRLYRAQAQK